MTFDIVTIFPDVINAYTKVGVLSSAIENGLLKVRAVNLRDYTHDKHRVVDDYSFGGGPGMVMKPEPLFRFYNELVASGVKPYVILTSPQGRKFDNEIASKLSKMR